MILKKKIPNDFYKLFRTKNREAYMQFVTAIYEENNEVYASLGLTQEECALIIENTIEKSKIVWQEEMTQSVTTKKQDNEDVQQQIRLLEDQLESVKKQRSKGNRKDENIDIMNSDMEYLRKKIELLKAGKGDFAIMMGNNGSNAAEGVSNAIAMSADTQIKSQALEASTQGTTDVVSASGAIDIML